MGKVKQIGIKNRVYYFHNDVTNIERLDSNLLKIDKKYYKGTNIYYIASLQKKNW